MTAAPPSFQPYFVGGRQENILRFGSKDTPQILLIEPLFEERNSLRSTLLDIARGLAERQIGCAIPNLPGTGESLLPQNAMTLTGLRDAVGQASAAIGAMLVATFRSGALLASGLTVHQCHIAPMSGADLCRQLGHLKTTTEEGDDFGGYRIPFSLLDEFASAQGCEGHIVEATELPSRPWLRAEPTKDLMFSQHVTELLEHKFRTCANI